jgi:NAD(P)-dependent dehydrogenase (short-subunit alcohol dehydrogenase family)
LAEKVPLQSNEGLGAYGLTKALLHNYTMIAARENPNIYSSSISPGFIETNMTAGIGEPNDKGKPEQGTVSIRHCLF